ARGPGGAGGGPAGAVHQQPQADRPGRPQLPRRARRPADRARDPAAAAVRRHLAVQLLRVREDPALPFLEQQPLFSAINFDLTMTVQEGNSTVMATAVASLLCPSDGEVTPEGWA